MNLVITAQSALSQGSLDLQLCEKWLLDSNGDCSLDILGIPLTGAVIGAIVLGLGAAFAAYGNRQKK